MHPVSVSPARRAALNALAKVRRHEAYSGPVVSAELARASLTAEDAALATRLAYGVLAAQGVLDYAIDRHAKGSLEPRVRDAMRLAAFELLFGRAPAYAIIDQLVSSVRRIRPQAAGLANAVMRRVAEDAASFPWGDSSRDRDALARLTVHPRWIVDLALRDLGEVAGREMLSCGLEPAPSYVRLDPFVVARDVALQALAEAAPEPSPPDPDCFMLARPSAAFGAAERAGWFPMDAAAQMAPLACRPAPGGRILDVGAGRGNKTMCMQAIARRQGGLAEITALDVHATKVDRLQSRLATSGVGGVRVVAGDGLRLAPVTQGEAFDTVLVDAPCTGLGTLRRYPEKRWRLAPGDVARMAGLQLSLLESASTVVRAGGRLVYSTCSIAREENGAVVDAFLAAPAGDSFALDTVDDLVPTEWGRFSTDGGCFQSWPTSGGPDGHYVAVLRRER